MSALATPQSPTEPHQPQVGKKRLWKRRTQLIIAGLVLVSISVVAFAVVKLNTPNPIPETIRSQVSFPLYYPTKAPANWHVDESSYSATSDVVMYTLNNDAGQKFFVSIQPPPSNFNYDGFKKQFSGNDEFNTDLGSVFIGNVATSAIASIRTNDGSWIIISAADPATKSELPTLARYFTKLR